MSKPSICFREKTSVFEPYNFSNLAEMDPSNVLTYSPKQIKKHRHMCFHLIVPYAVLRIDKLDEFAILTVYKDLPQIVCERFPLRFLSHCEMLKVSLN